MVKRINVLWPRVFVFAKCPLRERMFGSVVWRNDRFGGMFSFGRLFICSAKKAVRSMSSGSDARPDAFSDNRRMRV